MTTTRDGLPYSISMDNPQYRASLDEYHRLTAVWTADLYGRLRERVDAEPGLTVRWPSVEGMPWLEWDGDPRGGYWLAAGIQHEPQRPHHFRPAYMWLHYLRDSEDGTDFDRDDRPVDVKLSDTSAHDPDVILDIVFGALRRHRATL